MRWEQNVVRIMAAAIFILTFGVYVVTLAPGPFLIDSPSLTVAAWSRGSAHPPGFPLFLMLTHLATWFPMGSVAWRANLASAFFAALASAAAAVMVAEIVLVAAARRSGRRKSTVTAPAAAVIAPAMAAGGLLLAFSRTLWAYATIAEVYALNTLLVCALLVVALRWRRTRSPRLLYGGAVLAGAALGVHYVTAGFVLAGVLLFLLSSGGMKLLASRTFLLAVVIGAVTVAAVYSYLPVAARGNPALNWGDPDDSRDFVRHVTAKLYRSYVTAEEQGNQLGDLRRLVTRELAPPVFPAALILALIGLGTAFRRDRALFWSWMVIALAAAVWFNVYPISDDEDSYLLPLFIVLATAAGLGSAVVARERKVLAWTLVAIPVISMFGHWKDRDRSDFRVATDYAQNALRGFDRDGLLLTNSGHLWSVMVYLREAENVRRDVIPIHYGFLIRSWYLEQLERREPELMASVQTELAAYRPMVDIFENDEKRYQSDPFVQNEFAKRFGDFVIALISSRIASGGHVYATPDVSLKNTGVEGLIMGRIKRAYDSVPGGLTVEILPRRATPYGARAIPLEVRGLDDAQVRRTGGEVVERDIVPAYVSAYVLLGRYQTFSRDFAGAQRSYDCAMALDPVNEEVRLARMQLEQFRSR